MTFRVHQPQRQANGRAPLTVPTMSVFGDRSTQIAIPRATLRDAGLPDFPGARFDILIGEGADEGFIAVRKGTTYKAMKVGNGDSPTSICLRVSGVGKSRFAAKPVRSVEADSGLLIVRAPDGFPFKDAFGSTETIVATRAHTNGQALAA